MKPKLILLLSCNAATSHMTLICFCGGCVWQKLKRATARFIRITKTFFIYQNLLCDLFRKPGAEWNQNYFFYYLTYGVDVMFLWWMRVAKNWISLSLLRYFDNKAKSKINEIYCLMNRYRENFHSFPEKCIWWI